MADAAEITRWSVYCSGTLVGQTIGIDGLVSTFTDLLERIVRAEGTVQTVRLMPDFPKLEVTAAPSAAATAGTYFLLGVQHIMQGLDHLLFVLVLLLLVRDPRTLVATITAFTVAHSVTLAFAAVGLAAVPQPPVEALIALSIALVSSEVIRKDRGLSDLAGRFPWAIAFLFGLLHGFGFGGELREIGLPQKDLPLALLTFNLGVEAGQLVFVGVILLAAASLKLLLAVGPERPRFWISYIIGGLSAVWVVQRVSGFADCDATNPRQDNSTNPDALRQTKSC